MDASQFGLGEAVKVDQPYRQEPELGLAAALADVHMRRFVALVAEEIEAEVFIPSAGEAKEARDRDVFVDVRPVDGEAVADQLVAEPLLGARVAQPRKPLEGHGQGSTVLEVDDEGVRDEFDRPRARLGRASERSTHSIARGRRLHARS
jgi:hypothetical protein